MSDVIAKNQVTGISRTFNRVCWNLLGRNKGNWVEQSPQIVENSLTTGEKETEKETTEEIQEPVQSILTQTQETIDLFNKSAIGISKGALKDYLDKNNISYENNLKIKDLVKLIGENCNYDVKLLKDNF